MLVVDLDEASERAALASIDSITAQAEVDQREYAHLLRTILEEQDDLVKALAGKDEEFLAMFGGSAPEAQERPEVSAVHLVPGEQYHYVMLLFRTDLDWLSPSTTSGLTTRPSTCSTTPRWSAAHGSSTAPSTLGWC